MPKKYFYTDPLAAAWMAKHFGMLFNNLAEVLEGVDGDTTLLALPRFVNDCRFSRRYEIHIASLHLLEPQVGDLMTNFGVQAWRVVSKACGILSFADDRGELTGRAEEMQIIQRNGKSFMMPDCEGA